MAPIVGRVLSEMLTGFLHWNDVSVSFGHWMRVGSFHVFGWVMAKTVTSRELLIPKVG